MNAYLSKIKCVRRTMHAATAELLLLLLLLLLPP
jgi:hypothetical protein